jgi:hypothetical protein
MPRFEGWSGGRWRWTAPRGGVGNSFLSPRSDGTMDRERARYLAMIAGLCAVVAGVAVLFWFFVGGVA